ncbi:hypothetical protein ACRS6B_24310 [Nocardia asteroides]
MIGHPLGALAAEDLLVVPEGQVHGVAGTQARGQRRLGRLQDGQYAALVMIAPRPQMYSSSTTPANGGWVQRCGSSAGTTSWWASSIAATRPGSAPGQR